MNNLLTARATGIGSVPYKDTQSICEIILRKFPVLPFWPQLAQLDPRESMFIQYSENLPCLKPDLAKKGLYFDKAANQEDVLADFYERLGYKQYEYFKISEEYSRGFYALLDQAKAYPALFIKGQVAGPITFLASIIGRDNKPLIFDEMMSDAITRGLGMKAVWQARRIRESGKAAMIFFDEPCLSSMGSAFFPISSEQAAAILRNLISVVKEHENIPVGIHCCGNTDWPLLLESDIDILNFDAWEFARYFIPYADKIKKFLGRGGIIAWGIVPTSEFKKGLALADLRQRLEEIFQQLEAKGIEKKVLRQQMILTPSCGMGLMPQEDAEEVINLVSNLAGEMK